MDYSEHERTWVHFLTLTLWSAVAAVCLLIAMGAGFFKGFGLFGGILVFLASFAVLGWVAWRFTPSVPPASPSAGRGSRTRKAKAQPAKTQSAEAQGEGERVVKKRGARTRSAAKRASAAKGSRVRGARARRAAVRRSATRKA